MKRINKWMVITWMSIYGFVDIYAQELPRRVYLGIRMENLTEEVKKMMGLPGTKGILISEVLPGSTAEKAGFQKGDILTKINQTSFNQTDEVLKTLAAFKAGESFTYELLRKHKPIQGKSVFMSLPKEAYRDIKVTYTQSRSSIGLQRMIVQKPAFKQKQKRPLVVFIGGIGCYSLDSPLDTSRAEVQLMTQLTRSGFICARLEKPGMGDNAGFCKPCSEVSFIEETRGYVAAIQKLKQDPDVDTGRVFIFGHSMGGVFAPLIAREVSVKGIVAYGTIGSGFIEYLAKTRRSIAEAYQLSPIEANQLIQDFCECGTYYFAEKLTTEQAAIKKPICGEYLTLFDLRARSYNDELYALNIPELWSTYTGNVLLLWGASDYIASRDDHEIVFNTLRYYKKSNALFKVIENIDHAMLYAENFQHALTNPGKFNPAITPVVSGWLNQAVNQ